MKTKSEYTEIFCSHFLFWHYLVQENLPVIAVTVEFHKRQGISSLVEQLLTFQEEFSPCT